MDLLDNLLNEMDNHIVSRTSSSYFRQQQEQNRIRKALEEEEKKRYQEFRNKVTKDVLMFLKNTEHKQMRYPPMDKPHRLIIREVATDSDLVSHSFGSDEVFVIVYKQHTAPSPEVLKHLEQKYRGELRDGQESSCNITTTSTSTTECKTTKKLDPPSTVTPDSTVPAYQRKEKYRKILANSDTLFVLNQKKRDLRSIEQIQLDMQAEKKARPSS